MTTNSFRTLAFASGAAVLLGSAVPGLATTPGSDLFGNFIIGSDQSSSIRPNLFFDISGSAPLLVTGDDVSAQNVAIGFAFPLYGTSYSELTFATNGYISTDPTDTGPDLSNDGTLPTTPSTGGGARIYPHHDDTQANIYGAYYSADANPLGVDAFVSQFDACHFACDPNVAFDIQYNVFLLRDGTVVMAHNLAGPENGSGATVGLQNDSFDDGVAYFANEAGALVDGQTVVILPKDSGLSGDISNAAAESGAGETALLGDLVNSHLSSGGGSEVASRNAPLTFSTMGDNGINIWGGTGFAHSTAEASSKIRALSYNVTAGADLINTGDMTAGVGVSLAFGNVDLGAASMDTSTMSAFAYAGLSRGNMNLSGMLGYAMTDYSDFSTPFLTGISAEGRRFFGSLSASTNMDIGNDLVFTPGLTISAGTESIDNWTFAGTSRSVEDASFVKAELTGKFSTQMQFQSLEGTAYFKAGVDYVSTSGDSNVALYTFNHNSDRFGGILGVGIDGGSIAGTAVSASVTATGIGTDSMGFRGGLSVKF